MGDQVRVNGYGVGVVESLRPDGMMCQVRFLVGQFGAVCFPYGRLALVRKDRCARARPVS